MTKTKETTESILKILLGLKIGLWTIAAIAAPLYYYSNRSSQITIIMILSAFMLGNAAFGLLVWRELKRFNRRIYPIAIVWIVLNILVAFADQVGLIDLAFLSIDLAIFGLLVYTYRNLPKIHFKKEVKLNG